MTNTKVSRTLWKGLGLAMGLIIGNAVFLPLITNRTPATALVIGIMAGFLGLVIYTFIAIWQNRHKQE